MLLRKLLDLESYCAVEHKLGFRILKEEEGVEIVRCNKEEGSGRSQCNLYLPDDRALHYNSILRCDWLKKSCMKKRLDEFIHE